MIKAVCPPQLKVGAFRKKGGAIMIKAVCLVGAGAEPDFEPEFSRNMNQILS
jgi:hypothetical protein